LGAALDPTSASSVAAAVSHWRFTLASRPGAEQHGIASSTTMKAIAHEVVDGIVRPTLATLLAA
jgi:hypothetical protein